MFRLSRQTKILSPALIHRRIWFRGFHDGFIPDGTGNNGTRNNGHGGRSDILWDRMNRFDDKFDGIIKDHGTFKVDVIKTISESVTELRKTINDGNTEIRKDVAEVKSDQKLMKWQLHFLFIGASSLVLWSLTEVQRISFVDSASIGGLLAGGSEQQIVHEY